MKICLWTWGKFRGPSVLVNSTIVIHHLKPSKADETVDVQQNMLLWLPPACAVETTDGSVQLPLKWVSINSHGRFGKPVPQNNWKGHCWLFLIKINYKYFLSWFINHWQRQSDLRSTVKCQQSLPKDCKMKSSLKNWQGGQTDGCSLY